MSEGEKDEARRIAVEAVKDHLEISEKTRVRTSIRNAFAIVGTLIAATVAVCSFLNKLSNSQERIEASLLYKVPEAQLIGFANAMDRLNRGVQNKDGSLGLTVPDPTAFRPNAPVPR